MPIEIVDFAVTSTSQTPATLSLGMVPAEPGDFLIGQVIMRNDVENPDPLGITVEWGAASIGMLGFGFTYNLFPNGPSCGACLKHQVVATQTAELKFTFTGTVPTRRAIIVLRIRGLEATPFQGFDDREEMEGVFPTGFSTNPPGNPGDWCWLVCVGEHTSGFGVPPIDWAPPLVRVASVDADGLVASLALASPPQPGYMSFSAESGFCEWFGVGFFQLKEFVPIPPTPAGPTLKAHSPFFIETKATEEGLDLTRRPRPRRA